MSKAIQTLVNLKTYHIEFFCCNEVNDDLAHSIIDTLKYMPELQNILFNFSASAISNSAMTHLSDRIKKLNSLKNLSLYFGGCKFLSDEGI